MKPSVRNFLIIALVLMAGIIFLTPVGPKVRAYVGRLWSRAAVAQQEDKQLSETVYEWTLKDTNGNLFDFSDEQNRVVFLNFWATWCGPCLKEMPEIEQLYDDYGEKVDFLLVTQEKTSKVKAFLAKKDYNLPIYLTKDVEVPEELISKTLPTTYIIDASGKIALAKTGAARWNSKEIRSLLDRLVQERETE